MYPIIYYAYQTFRIQTMWCFVHMYSLIHKFIKKTEEGNIYVYQDGEKQWEQSILVVRSVYN